MTETIFAQNKSIVRMTKQQFLLASLATDMLALDFLETFE